MIGVPYIDLYQAYSFGYEAGWEGATISHSDCLWGSIYRLGWHDGNSDRTVYEDSWHEQKLDDDDCAAEDIDTQRRESMRLKCYRMSFRPPVV